MNLKKLASSLALPKVQLPKVKLPGVGDLVSKTVGAGVGSAFDAFESALKKAPQVDQRGFGAINFNPYDLPVDDIKKVLKWVFPPKIRDREGDKFIQQSKPFRDTLGQVRSLQGEIGKLPPNDPRLPELKKKLAAAEGQLKSMSGYTAATAPKPGALWIDPQLQSRDVPGGQVSASRFPTGTPVTTPPAPMDHLFRGGKSIQLVGADGKVRTVSSPDEYRKVVAENRAAAGMPVAGGEPTGVHLSLEGGGGKGKRYGAALAEMYDQGVIPTSVSGTSVGGIAAALVAAGADPKQAMDRMRDPALAGWFDVDLSPDDGGVCNGQVAYDTLDKWLRDLTGIHDRPVTFADLKMPLQILGATYSDTNPPAGKEDLSRAENRIFVFSQETTPDTPVALAVRATMAIPGVWDPVQMIDPTTGRAVHLVDSGALDGLPMRYHSSDLPVIGMHLYERASNHPSHGTAKEKPLPKENLDSTHIIWNVLNGLDMVQDAATDAKDHKDRNDPRAGEFIIGLPVWNLDDPSQANSTFKLTYDEKLDPILDRQTRQVTRDFLRNVLDDMGNKQASFANISDDVPADLKFIVPVESKGKKWMASYSGGDKVVFTSGGERKEVKLGKAKVEAMYLDGQAFGDLASQLRYALETGK
jgi:NTE family protein